MTVSEGTKPAVDAQAGYDARTRQTEMFIRECLEHMGNDSERTPDQCLVCSGGLVHAEWCAVCGEIHAEYGPPPSGGADSPGGERGQ